MREFSSLAKIEVLVALLCKDNELVAGSSGTDSAARCTWDGEFNASCRAMKLLFPEEHPLDEQIDVPWADSVLLSADQGLVDLVKQHI